MVSGLMRCDRSPWALTRAEAALQAAQIINQPCEMALAGAIVVQADLATHAEFLSGLPEESFIVFGNGDRVSLRDIADWSLPNVDLIVLSACKTAVEEALGNGEEILGFGYPIQPTGFTSVGM